MSDKSTISTHTWKRYSRRRVAHRAGYRCAHCRKFVGMSGDCDHIIDRKDCEAAGIDPFDLTNVQYLCKSCHSKKTNAARFAAHVTRPRAPLRRVRVRGRASYLAAVNELRCQPPQQTTS
ncbi:HNH endonuclease [Albibacillus kandeliae]|uniref:HNH endonuclease n=1 Tax=Albibacillus kandeliae TaxID=2174228 RepID=UPI000D685832